MRKVILFVLISFAVSWAGWIFSWGPVAIFGPLLGALAVQPKGVLASLKGMGTIRFKPGLVLQIALIGLGLPLAALLLMQAFTGETLSVSVDWAGLPALLVMILFFGGPMEEFGWRGFMQQPMVERFGWFPGVLVLGFVHGLWHLPLHFMEGTVQAEIPIAQFILITVIGALIYAHFYQSGHKSLWLPILFHWLSNVGAALFPYWTNLTGRLIFLVLNLLLVGWLIVRHRVRKEAA